MDQAEKQLAFLKEITRCSGSEDVFEKNIAPVRNVLKKYLPDIYPAHAELCARLESAYERLKDYAAYRQLVKKNIISLCGKTASGKSSFFNSLYGGGILPVDTDINCAVPAYVICGSSQYSYGINRFGHFITMEPEDLASAFSGSENDDMPLGHLFSSILTYASTPDLRHIAFMETPGYTRSYGEMLSTDELKTIQRINFSDYILWFADININTLGISDNDIRMLKKTDPHIPKLIIINKADAFSTRDMPEIVEKTKKILNARGVNYIDVLTYSKNHPEKYDKYKILAYLDRWDKSPSVISFSQEFDKIFDAHQSTQKIDDLRAQLLPVIQTASENIFSVQNAFGSSKKKPAEEFVPVESVQQTPISRLKNIDFSKIKLTDLPIPNPEKLFRSYNDRNITDVSAYERYINSVSIILSEQMKDIDPSFSASSRNIKYKKEVSAVICRIFGVSEEPVSSSKKSGEGDESGAADERRNGKRSRTSGSRREREREHKREAEQTAAHEETADTSAPARRERSSSLPSRRRLR